MADPLSICASVVGIVTAAYASGQAVYDIVKGITDAPKVIADLSTDLETLTTTLQSLEQELRRTTTLTPNQITALEELKVPLNSCARACDDFKARLKKTLSHSDENPLIGHEFLF